MNRVIIIQPQTSLMLLDSIRTLLRKLLISPATRRIRCVFIDSISSGLWIDQTSPYELKNGTDALSELLKISNEHELVIFGTRRKFFSPSKGLTLDFIMVL